MMDIKDVARVVVKTANFYQLPIEEVLEWIKEEIIDIPNTECFHYEVKE